MRKTRNIVRSRYVLFDILLIMRRRCPDLMLKKKKYFEKVRTKIDKIHENHPENMPDFWHCGA